MCLSCAGLATEVRPLALHCMPPPYQTKLPPLSFSFSLCVTVPQLRYSDDFFNIIAIHFTVICCGSSIAWLSLSLLV